MLHAPTSQLRSIAVAIAAAAVLGLWSLAAAGGPNPYPGAFDSSADGRWYTYVGYDGSFWLVSRRADLPARVEVLDQGWDTGAWREIHQDPRDKVVAVGRCARPEEVATLDRGRGFLALEDWGGISRGRILARHDGRGVEKWTRPLAFFFDETKIEPFTRGMNSTCWRRRWWLSMDESYAVLVGFPAHARVVGVDDGALRPLAREVVVDRLRSASAPASVPASVEDAHAILDAAIAEKADWLSALAREEITGSATKDDGVLVRLYAALGSGTTATDRAAYRDVMKGTRDQKARAYGLSMVPWFDRDHALEIVMDAVREGDPAVQAGVQENLQLIAVQALPRLVAAATDKDLALLGRIAAIRALGVIARTREAPVENLVALLSDPERAVGLTAEAALMESRAPAARDALVKVLIAGTLDDEVLIVQFARSPDLHAVPGLAAALRRRSTDAPKDVFWRNVALDALKGATGQDFGNAPDAWDAWFSQRKQ